MKFFLTNCFALGTSQATFLVSTRQVSNGSFPHFLVSLDFSTYPARLIPFNIFRFYVSPRLISMTVFLFGEGDSVVWFSQIKMGPRRIGSFLDVVLLRVRSVISEARVHKFNKS